MKDELGKMTLKSVSGKNKRFFTPINICLLSQHLIVLDSQRMPLQGGKKKIKYYPSRNCKKLSLM